MQYGEGERLYPRIKSDIPITLEQITIAEPEPKEIKKELNVKARQEARSSRKQSEAESKTHKVLSLINWLIIHFSNEGDIILDPFFGSGTTLRACKDLNRKCIGIEINKEYCDMAVQRLGQEVLDFRGILK